MKYRLLIQGLMLFLIFPGVVFSGQADKTSEYDLELTIHCPKKDIKQGDEIPIVFTIKNNGEIPYVYDKRNYDRSGRLREFKLLAKRDDGTIVPDPREKYKEGIGGGLSGGMGKIKNGESFNQTIALNRWALIKEPSHYSVTGTYYYDIEDPNAEQVKNIVRMKEVSVKSKPIGIVVQQRSYWQMGRYIKNLLRDLNSVDTQNFTKMQREREGIVKKLIYTCDKRIVPALLELMYDEELVFWVKEAFLCYLPREPKIKNSILKVMRKHGLAYGMQSTLEELGCTEQGFKQLIPLSFKSKNHKILIAAVIATQNHPDDSYTSKLIDIATDPNSPARHQAIYALAFNRTDEGVRILKNLLKDTDKDIRETAESAIRQAYRRRQIDSNVRYLGRPLRDNDFGEEFGEDPKEWKRKIL